MVSKDEARSPSVAARAAWILLAPLCVSMPLGACVLVANGVAGAGFEADWALLILLGPAIPLYLVLLPLLPLVLRALRRGWAPRPISVVVIALLVSTAIDVVFWMGRP